MRKGTEQFAIIMARDWVHGRRTEDEIREILCSYATAHYPNDSISKYCGRVEKMMDVARKEYDWWLAHPQLIDREVA